MENEHAMSPEELLEFKEFLSQILKPTIQQKVSAPPVTDWLAYFRDLHDFGTCFVTEEFLRIVIPAYGKKDSPSSHLIGFQAAPEAGSDVLVEIVKDDYEWLFDHKMIMDEIRAQGFNPIAHPWHIAWEIMHPMLDDKKEKPTFYMKGTDGRVYIVEIDFLLEEDSDRFDAFFEARKSRKAQSGCPETECPSIFIVGVFEPGDSYDSIQILINSQGEPKSAYTFAAVK